MTSLLEKQRRLRINELAHELKNPIILIANAIEQSSWRSKERTVFYNKVKTEINWMVQYINQVLELARAEAGRTKLHPQLVFIDDLLAETIREMESWLKQNQKSILQTANNTTDPTLMADEGLLHRLVELLLKHAAFFALKCVRINLGIDVPKNRILLELLFDAERSHGGLEPHHNSRKIGLTGLELPLAQWIAKAHGGSIETIYPSAETSVIRVHLSRKLAT